MRNPVKGYKQLLYPQGDVTQWFGENYKLYNERMGLKGHNGIDIVRPHGEEMYAVEDGTIVEVNDNPQGFGRHLRFVSNTPDEKGQYREWTYGHCSAIFVSIGDEITAGQKIALMGNTGFVVSGATPFWKNNPYAGTHLHLGLRLVKRPKRGGWSYAGSKIKIEVVNYGNGYKGAVNPELALWEATDGVAQPTIKELQLTVISLLNRLLTLLKKK
jgi:murein DD-endopeptidase MepM/ murein hydrolase activator NlpD